MSQWTVYCRGICDPNPGGCMSVGWAIVIDGKREFTGKKSIQKPGSTNIIAEFIAIGTALAMVKTMVVDTGKPCESLLIISSLQSVIYQLTGKNEVNADHLVGYHRRCLEILTEIGVPWEARWMKIDQNAVADTLATESFVEATGRKPKVWGKKR